MMNRPSAYLRIGLFCLIGAFLLSSPNAAAQGMDEDGINTYYANKRTELERKLRDLQSSYRDHLSRRDEYSGDGGALGLGKTDKDWYVWKEILEKDIQSIETELSNLERSRRDEIEKARRLREELERQVREAEAKVKAEQDRQRKAELKLKRDQEAAAIRAKKEKLAAERKIKEEEERQRRLEEDRIRREEEERRRKEKFNNDKQNYLNAHAGRTMNQHAAVEELAHGRTGEMSDYLDGNRTEVSLPNQDFSHSVSGQETKVSSARDRLARKAGVEEKSEKKTENQKKKLDGAELYRMKYDEGKTLTAEEEKLVKDYVSSLEIQDY